MICFKIIQWIVQGEMMGGAVQMKLFFSCYDNFRSWAVALLFHLLSFVKQWFLAFDLFVRKWTFPETTSHFFNPSLQQQINIVTVLTITFILVNELKQHLHIVISPEFLKLYCSSESPTILTKVHPAELLFLKSFWVGNLGRGS